MPVYFGKCFLCARQFLRSHTGLFFCVQAGSLPHAVLAYCMQAKRTNIGIAMITNPRVLFLDEPTSGLDSYTSNEVKFLNMLTHELTAPLL